MKRAFLVPIFLRVLPVTVQKRKGTERSLVWQVSFDEYIQSKLLNWSNERGQDLANPDTSAIMQPIAHTLTKAQIAAVAAYLNYLE